MVTQSHLNSVPKVAGSSWKKSNQLTPYAGFRVFATARSLAKIEPLLAKGIEVLELDVTKSESIRIVKNEVQNRTHGKLDFLINNA